MAEQSGNEEGEEDRDCPCKKQPRETYFLHADVRHDGEGDGEAEGQRADQRRGEEAAPEPEELWEDSADEAVDEDVGPHQFAGQLEGLEARVVEQQEARPQEQQVEQAHKPKEHGNVQLILPIHFPLDHDNVDSIQRSPRQRPQRTYCSFPVWAVHTGKTDQRNSSHT